MVVWNRFVYQVSEMIETNAYTSEKSKFYKSTLQTISKGGGDCDTKVGFLCAGFVDMGSPVRTQVENGPCKLFYL